MLPQIWLIDSYSLMIFLGVIACFILFWLFRKKHKISEKFTFDIFILATISIAVGILFAVLFQLLFDAINGVIRGSAMTFFGGLVGGTICFLLGYFLILKKRYPNADFNKDVLPIAPASITVAHGFGRIGCFLAGCCYGIKTDSDFGVLFPNMSYKVLPTQLYEAIFLLLLTVVLFIIAYKKRTVYTMPIYLISYGIFRFSIEFLRGDNRGAFLLNLSPSQWFSIAAIITAIILIIIFKRKVEKEKITDN